MNSVHTTMDSFLDHLSPMLVTPPPSTVATPPTPSSPIEFDFDDGDDVFCEQVSLSTVAAAPTPVSTSAVVTKADIFDSEIEKYMNFTCSQETMKDLASYGLLSPAHSNGDDEFDLSLIATQDIVGGDRIITQREENRKLTQDYFPDLSNQQYAIDSLSSNGRDDGFNSDYQQMTVNSSPVLYAMPSPESQYNYDNQSVYTDSIQQLPCSMFDDGIEFLTQNGSARYSPDSLAENQHQQMKIGEPQSFIDTNVNNFASSFVGPGNNATVDTSSFSSVSAVPSPGLLTLAQSPSAQTTVTTYPNSPSSFYEYQVSPPPLTSIALMTPVSFQQQQPMAPVFFEGSSLVSTSLSTSTTTASYSSDDVLSTISDFLDHSGRLSIDLTVEKNVEIPKRSKSTGGARKRQRKSPDEDTETGFVGCKRDQNREAARRYRDKKKVLEQELLETETQLIKENKNKRKKFKSMQREFEIYRKLMTEFMEKKKSDTTHKLNN